MNAMVYAEPYRLRAGALALVVHLAFFVLLYFGVSWQVDPPQGMVVDIWDSLPGEAPVKPEPPKPVEPPPVKPPEPVKPVMPPSPPVKVAEKKVSQETSKPIATETKRQPEKVDVKAEQKLQAELERARVEQANLVAKLRSKVQALEKVDSHKEIEAEKTAALTKAEIALAEKKKLLEKQKEAPKAEPKRPPEKTSAQPDRKVEEEKKAEAEKAKAEEEKRVEAEKARAEKKAKVEKLRAEVERKAEAARLEAERKEAERLEDIKKAEAEKKARDEKFRAEQREKDEKYKAEQKEREEKLRAEQRARDEKIRAEQKEREEKIRAEQKARDERARAEQKAMAEEAAATSRIVDEYKARITAKIRRNIVMPPDIPYNAVAEFDVTLLPGGTVFNAQLVKPSGSAIYDLAVERAIKKSQPLPLPPDPALFIKFRELHLKVSPKE